MSNPYEILGVTSAVSEADIRQRYLQLVREFPPDRAPERFAQIRAAYEELRDPLVRLERQLFSTSTEDSLATLAAELRERLRNARLPTDALLGLAECR